METEGLRIERNSSRASEGSADLKRRNKEDICMTSGGCAYRGEA